jgi:hypothetical protein
VKNLLYKTILYRLKKLYERMVKKKNSERRFGGSCLQFQLLRRQRQENCALRSAQAKVSETLSQKQGRYDGVYL